MLECPPQSSPSAERIQEDRAVLNALDRAQAIIEFDLEGVILRANDNFLATVGYGIEEIRGQHHRMFCSAELAASREYQAFWAALKRGEFRSGEFRRVGTGGRDIWLQASYNPILDDRGRPFKVVKYASDITAAKLAAVQMEGQLAAIDRSQAVIEFAIDGTIITANDNFLATLGYGLDEIRGQHHRMFCDPVYAASPEYQAFWAALGRGEFFVDEFKRLGKGGKEVWIQASYNPIFDPDGRPHRVVKYATDISGRKFAIQRTRESLLKLADGDLSGTLEGRFEGEFEELKTAVNSTLTRLGEMVDDILAAAAQVGGAASEIAKGNGALNERAQTQASAIEETAAALEQLTATVNQSANNARQANDVAAETGTLARKGGDVVQRAVEAMTRIDGSSQKIQDIIGVIDEIAFQTNLLALNAAVEAARAGEQGRGFAVVASEVRNLAQRSAVAAKDIKTLIKDSVECVKEGSRLVGDSGRTLDEIIAAVSGMAGMIAEIANACSEQAEGIRQINGAISDMDTVVQQNAALVEETTAASRNMDDQARKLNELMGFFS
ncbi:MAG: PAS domain-containing protein [Planctomycetes bacterium]|nr:PAS domain-containing protein [Planctomycetota bacterium]